MLPASLDEITERILALVAEEDREQVSSLAVALAQILISVLNNNTSVGEANKIINSSSKFSNLIRSIFMKTDIHNITMSKPEVSIEVQTGDIAIRNVAGGDIFNISLFNNVVDIPPIKVVEVCRNQVTNALEAVRRKYRKNLYIKRRVIENILISFINKRQRHKSLEPNTLVLIAPAGSGKTNLLSYIADKYSNEDPAFPVLYFHGHSIQINNEAHGILTVLQQAIEVSRADLRLQTSADILHLLHRSASKLSTYAIIVIDGINEHPNPRLLRDALLELSRLTKGMRIKILLSCRDYFWGIFETDLWTDYALILSSTNSQSLILPELTDSREGDLSLFTVEEFREAKSVYFREYNITGYLQGDAQRQCRHPLLLEFFCNAYSGQNIGVIHSIRLKELFDLYWKRKINAVAESSIRSVTKRRKEGVVQDIERFILDIARYMLDNKSRTIETSQLSIITSGGSDYHEYDSTIGRIADEYIVLEEVTRGFGLKQTKLLAFVYEEFMEYAMALYLIRQWEEEKKELHEIINSIENLFMSYSHFEQIIGVVTYIAIMLQSRFSSSLWKELVQKDKIWLGIILETIRKLPISQIDDGVYNFIEEILVSKDRSMIIQVLDLLKNERVTVNHQQHVYHLVRPFFNTKDESLRRRALLILANLSSNLSFPVLLKALNDKSKVIRDGAAKKLKMPIHKQYWNSRHLISLLKDDSLENHKNAIIALGILGEKDGINPLMEHLTQCAPEDQTVIFNTLRKIGGYEVSEALCKWLSKNSDDVHLQRRSILLLGELKEVRAVPQIVQYINSNSEPLAVAAISALASFPEYNPAILGIASALSQENTPSVTQHAIDTLSQLPETERLLLICSTLFFDKRVLVKKVNLLSSCLNGTRFSVSQYYDNHSIKNLLLTLLHSPSKIVRDGIILCLSSMSISARTLNQNGIPITQDKFDQAISSVEQRIPELQSLLTSKAATIYRENSKVDLSFLSRSKTQRTTSSVVAQTFIGMDVSALGKTFHSLNTKSGKPSESVINYTTSPRVERLGNIERHESKGVVIFEHYIRPIIHAQTKPENLLKNYTETLTQSRIWVGNSIKQAQLKELCYSRDWLRTLYWLEDVTEENIKPLIPYNIYFDPSPKSQVNTVRQGGQPRKDVKPHNIKSTQRSRGKKR